MTANYCQAALVQHWARDPDRKKKQISMTGKVKPNLMGTVSPVA